MFFYYKIFYLRDWDELNSQKFKVGHCRPGARLDCCVTPESDYGDTVAGVKWLVIENSGHYVAVYPEYRDL